MSDSSGQNIHISTDGGGFGLHRILSAAVSLIFVFYIGYLVWLSLGPQKPDPDPACKKMADLAIGRIVEQIRNERGEIRSTVMIHFANDPSDYFSDTLREKLNSSGILQLEDRSFSEKLKSKLNFRNTGATSAEAAMSRATGYDVQGVLWGSIQAFETSDVGTIVKGSWQLLDHSNGKVIASGDFEEGTVKGATTQLLNSLSGKNGVLQVTAEKIPWHIRFLGFVLFVLLLPVFTISFIRTMVAKRSNKINAFMLSIYTVIDVILAFFMIGCSFASIWSVVFFLLGSLLAFGYNYLLMCYALKLES